MKRERRYSGEVLLELHYTSGRAVRVIAIDPISGTEVTMIGDKQQGEAVLKRLAARKLAYVLNKKKKEAEKKDNLF
ncbi:MAG: hypothetical protein ISR45_06410 [Rhodospirillales bacterium]|nr:hypothetical protein [Rhodospirillales bacterium]